jgi:hypothetical protein
VHATVAHVHAVDDDVTERAAALDDPAAHGGDVAIFGGSG